MATFFIGSSIVVLNWLKLCKKLINGYPYPPYKFVQCNFSSICYWLSNFNMLGLELDPYEQRGLSTTLSR